MIDQILLLIKWGLLVCLFFLAPQAPDWSPWWYARWQRRLLLTWARPLHLQSPRRQQVKKCIKTPFCNTCLKYPFNKTHTNVFVFQTAACLECATMGASKTFPWGSEFISFRCNKNNLINYEGHWKDANGLRFGAFNILWQVIHLFVCLACVCSTMRSTIKALIMRTTAIRVTRLRPTVTLITSRPGQNIYPPAGTNRTDRITSTRTETMHTHPQARMSPTALNSPLGMGRNRTCTLIMLFNMGQATMEMRHKPMESITTSDTTFRWMPAASLLLLNIVYMFINLAHFLKVFDNEGAGNKPTGHYKASYHPHQPSNQPKMFSPQVTNQNGHFDQIQRDFLDSTQSKILLCITM